MGERNTSEHDAEDGREQPPQAAANKLHVHIGSRLRRLFNGVVEEQIPDRFRLLIEELDQRPKAERPDEHK